MGKCRLREENRGNQNCKGGECGYVIAHNDVCAMRPMQKVCARVVGRPIRQVEQEEEIDQARM